MNQEAGTPEDKPVLDEEGFQRLLAAAYILQPPDVQFPAQPMGAGHPRTFAAGKIVQERTLPLPVRQPPSSPPMSRPMYWRTAEAFAIAAIFAVAAVSIHRVAPLSAGSRPPEVTVPRDVDQNGTSGTKLSLLTGQAVVKPNLPQSPNSLQSSPRSSPESLPQPGDDDSADSFADEIVIRYPKRAADSGTAQAQLLPPENRPLQNKPPENTRLKPGVRFTFGRGGMLAADTVTRYGADAWTAHLQNQKKTPSAEDYK